MTYQRRVLWECPEMPDVHLNPGVPGLVEQLTALASWAPAESEAKP